MKRLSKAVRAIVAACMAMATCGFAAGCASDEEYVPELGAPQLSSPAIGEDGVLRVGVNTNNSPLAGKSGDRIIGIDVDIAAALADELGLSLKVVDVGNNAADAIDDDEVDVVLGIDSTSKEDGYWMSSQYLPTGVVLFEQAGSNAPAPEAGSDVQIAAQVSSKSAWAVTNTFGEDALVSASDLSSAFADLGSGKVEYVASDAIIGMYAASRQNVEVEIAALLDTAGGYCAMCANDNTELQEAIGGALDTLVSNGVVDVIEDKWLGQPVNLNGIPKIVSNNPKTSNVEEPEEGADGEDSDGEEADGTTGSSSSSASATSASSSSRATSN